MRKLLGLVLIGLSLNAVAAGGVQYIAPPKTVAESVEDRIQRREVLRDEILLSKMKIAAFEVEIAKSKLDIATAEAENRKLDAEAEAMAKQFKTGTK